MSTTLAPHQQVDSTAHKIYFANLDFLRVVAFSMVFTMHTNLAETLGLLSSNTLYHRFLRLATDGVLGVSFFFVLSGFLITYLLLVEVEKTGRIALAAFYMRRTLRIWPLYLVVVLFGSFLYPGFKSLAGIPHDFSNHVIYYFTFLSNFDYIYLIHHGLATKATLMLVVTWSVAIEEQFYLLWPLLFLLVPTRHYQGIFYGVILSSLLFRYLHRTDGPVLTYHTLSVASDLAIGGLCAWHSRNNPAFIRTIQQLPLALVVVIYVLGFLMLLFHDMLYPTVVASVLDRLVCSMLFAFILLEQNFSHGSIVKLSQFQRISSFGKYTYGLYLLHPIAIQVATLLVMRVPCPSQGIAGGLFRTTVALAVVLPMAYASYNYFELPFLKLKHRFG